METLVPAAICHHGRIRVATREAMEFVDVTARVEALAVEAGIHAGLVNVQSLHTTAAVIVNEHEPLLLSDFTSLLERWAPLPQGTFEQRLAFGVRQQIKHCQPCRRGLREFLDPTRGRMQSQQQIVERQHTSSRHHDFTINDELYAANETPVI